MRFLVLESIQYSNPTHWSTSSREPLHRRSASPQFKQPSSTSTVSLSTASLSTSTTKSDAMHERLPLTVCEEQPFHKSKALDRALRSTNFFALLLVLVLDSNQYSNQPYRSASYGQEPRSTIGIAAVQTAIEPLRVDFRSSQSSI